MIIKRCGGNGLGVCSRCESIHGFNRHWMTMLFEIEGLEGFFCSRCVDDLQDILEEQFFIKRGTSFLI